MNYEKIVTLYDTAEHGEAAIFWAVGLLGSGIGTRAASAQPDSTSRMRIARVTQIAPPNPVVDLIGAGLA
jgi:hypothetical protein